MAFARGQSIAPCEANLPNHSVSPPSPFPPCSAPQAKPIGNNLNQSSMSRKPFRVLDERLGEFSWLKTAAAFCRACKSFELQVRRGGVAVATRLGCNWDACGFVAVCRLSLFFFFPIFQGVGEARAAVAREKLRRIAAV